MNIALAILLGLVFGYVLQRVGAADPDQILGMLRLTDLRLARAILSGIGLSSVLLFLGLAAGLVDVSHIHVKPLYTGVIAGGLVFGIGWAGSGFCPGTGVVAAGAGRRDALFFLLGGLLGAGAFMLTYAPLGDTVFLEALLGGKVTLAGTGAVKTLLPSVNGALVALVAGLVLIALAFLLPGSFRHEKT